ncbi:MAG: hypothetical protein ACYTHM_07555 [Planctomycetota bacterium]|jgi:hypothetical protein
MVQGCWNLVPSILPFTSTLGVLVALGALLVIGTLVVAGLAYGKRQKYIPLARRKVPQDGLRMRLKRRQRNRTPRIHRLSSPPPVPGTWDRATPSVSISPPAESTEPPPPLSSRNQTENKRWLIVVAIVGLLICFLLEYLWVTFRYPRRGGGFLSVPTVMVGGFILLFASHFLPLGKLKYGLFAAIPVGGLIFLGFYIDLLALWPVLLVALTVATLLFILWSGRKEKPPAFWREWRRNVKRTHPGEKTARILGEPDPEFDHAEPDRHLKPARESKAKGIYFRIP